MVFKRNCGRNAQHSWIPNDRLQTSPATTHHYALVHPSKAKATTVATQSDAHHTCNSKVIIAIRSKDYGRIARPASSELRQLQMPIPRGCNTIQSHLFRLSMPDLCKALQVCGSRRHDYELAPPSSDSLAVWNRGSSFLSAVIMLHCFGSRCME